MSYIFVIDDDEDFLNVVAKVLNGEGHEVAVELSLKNAVAKMEQNKPDLIILDVMFPENSLGGFELARKLKKNNEKLKDVPILMLTAINQKYPFDFTDKDIDEDWLPVSDFLEKPINLDELKKKVQEILQR